MGTEEGWGYNEDFICRWKKGAREEILWTEEKIRGIFRKITYLACVIQKIW